MWFNDYMFGHEFGKMLPLHIFFLGGGVSRAHQHYYTITYDGQSPKFIVINALIGSLGTTNLYYAICEPPLASQPHMMRGGPPIDLSLVPATYKVSRVQTPASDRVKIIFNLRLSGDHL